MEETRIPKIDYTNTVTEDSVKVGSFFEGENLQIRSYVLVKKEDTTERLKVGGKIRPTFDPPKEYKEQ